MVEGHVSVQLLHLLLMGSFCLLHQIPLWTCLRLVFWHNVTAVLTVVTEIMILSSI
jgi:hypothetical protein